MASTRLNLKTSSDLDAFIPKKWGPRIRFEATRNGVWGRFTGPEGTDSAVIEKNDFTKEAGQIIYMLVTGGLYGAGQTGEGYLPGNEEKSTDTKYPIKIKKYKHATAVTDYANEVALGREIERCRKKITDWTTRKLDTEISMEMIVPTEQESGFATPTPLTVYCGDATSIATLSSSCALDLDDLEMVNMVLSRRGARPIKVEDPAGANAPVSFYGLMIDEVSKYRLFSDDKLRQVLQSALPRSFNHPLFTGALGMHNGVMLFCQSAINVGCWQGTPMRPECYIYTTAASGQPTVSMAAAPASGKGPQYTAFFRAGDVVTIGRDATCTNTEDLTILSLTDYSITFTTNLTYTHYAGAKVTLQNYASRMIAFGAESIARAWARNPEPISQVDNYKEDIGLGARFVMGQHPLQNTDGSISNYVLLAGYAKTPKWNI